MMAPYPYDGIRKLDEKTIEELKIQYKLHKEWFRKHRFNMSENVFLIELTVLVTQKDILYPGWRNETLQEAIERSIRETSWDLDCCGHKFTTLVDFMNHKEETHMVLEDIDLSDDPLIHLQPPPEYINDLKFDCDNSLGSENVKSSENNENLHVEKKVVAKKKVSRRRYICLIEGCEKIYTSSHGLNYHRVHGHIDKDESDKPYPCVYQRCNRRYKNPNGLKYHIMSTHLLHKTDKKCKKWFFCS